MAKQKLTSTIVNALPGVILIMVVAGALTYGGAIAVAEATKPKPVVVKTVTVTKVEEPKVVTPAPAPEPAPKPATPTYPKATTNSFVYLRPTASTSGAPLQDLQAGTKVEYVTKSAGLWQKVTVNGVTGYVYKKWLTY